MPILLLKKLENINDKNEGQLQAIKDQGEKQLKELKNIGNSKMLKAISEISKENNEGNKLLSELEKTDKTLDDAELICTKPNGTKCNFNIFAIPLKFTEKIHNIKITVDKRSREIRKLISRLENYNTKNKKEIDQKNRVLESARELFHAKENIVDLFRKVIFPYKGNVFKTKEEESEKKKLEKLKDDYNKFFKYIEDESMGINYNLFEDYFRFSVPRSLPKELYKIKNKNDKLVNVINSGLIDLKNKIEENISK